MPVHAIIKARHLIGDQERSRMYALYRRYFTHTNARRFHDDLAQKDWVMLQTHADGTMAGFSTAACFRLTVGGQAIRILFSGDTIVDQTAWHSSTLAGSFGHLALRMAREAPEPLYWLLITKGFRTYRFLPVFFNSFHPVYHQPTPPGTARLLDAVCRMRFGPAWQPEQGVVDFGPSHERLAPSWCPVPPHRRSDPHVAFFLTRNPRYAQGTELACIAPITETNFNRYGRRVINATQVSWDE